MTSRRADRVGVFICWCGLNIGGVVDVPQAAERIATYPGVVEAHEYKYMCSDPGQTLIRNTIEKADLDAVVVAACSPNMHEDTFRTAAYQAGINPYRVEMANIREQCAWVHRNDKQAATDKAVELIQTMVEKARGDQPLESIQFSVNKKAMVIGGGISGMQAALDIANAGHPVLLVEREPSIGGRMAQLGETFPTLDCASCILTPRTAEVARHPNIQLMTNTEVVGVDGYVGNFKVTLRRQPTYVDWDVCTGCAECTTRCPVKVSSEFDRGMGERRAISIMFPQAVPYRPTIDAEHCLKHTKDRCGLCERICPTGAIRYDQKPQEFETEIGAVVLATGYDVLPTSEFPEYGYGKLPDVIDSLQFERLNSASGPTGGQILRPSNGEPAKQVVFIQCAGSRDPEQHKAYCSKICCMYTAKHARLFKQKVPDGQAYSFYMDIRAGGKGYDEFVQRAIEDDGTLYFRGRVARVFEEGDRVAVWGVDTLSNRRIELQADLVVLASAIVPRPATRELARLFKVGVDENGFLTEAHPKLRPVESVTRGVYVSGVATGPKDIPDSVSQAGAAASKVLALFAGDLLEHPPTVVEVDEEICVGCAVCVPACPYDARSIDETARVARVNEILCHGCGACAVACPNGATQLRNSTKRQLLNMIDSVMV